MQPNNPPMATPSGVVAVLCGSLRAEEFPQGLHIPFLVNGITQPVTGVGYGDKFFSAPVSTIHFAAHIAGNKIVGLSVIEDDG